MRSRQGSRVQLRRALHAVRSHEALVAAVLVAGGALRVQQYLANRSLWLDEALLANNIVRRDYAELLDPLDGEQGAPVLFLWLQRSAVLAGGNNELALRLVPLVAGIGLLPVAYLLGRRLGSRWWGLVALVLVAFSPALVRYSTEVKQYSTDALVCAVLVLVAVDWTRSRSRRTLIALALVGAFSIWLSHPLALVAAGVGLVLFVDAAARRETVNAGALVLVGVVWGISAAGAYVVSLQDLRANEFLASYWQLGFPPSGASTLEVIAWIPDALREFTDNPGRLRFPVVGGVLVAAGVWFIARTGGPTRLALVAVPPMAVLLAAALRAYPFSGRLALFLVPFVAVLAAAAVATKPLASAVTVPLLLAAASPWWGDIIDTALDPAEIAELRPALEHVRAHAEPGDQIYIHGTAVAPYNYYAHVVGVEASWRTVWLNASRCDDPPQPLQTLAETTSPGERAWVVFSYTLSGRPADDAQRVRDEFDEIGEQLDLYTAHDASAGLFLIGAPPSTDLDTPEGSRLACLAVRDLPPVPRTGLSSGPLGSGEET